MHVEGASNLARTSRPVFILLIALAAVPAFSTNVFVPSMPGLASHFQSSLIIVQFTLTFYLVTLGIGQLLLGPLSDRYGRRPVLLVGLAVYMGGSVICLVATSIDVLITGRIVQAAGGSTGLVIGRAMIRDLYPRGKAAGVLGYVTMTMAIVTGLAPIIGAFLEEWWGWHASFVLMFGLGALMILGSVRVARETAPVSDIAPSLARTFAAYAIILRTAQFQRFGGYSVCILASYYAFMAGAPYVMIVLFERPPSQFGLYYIFAGACYITGNYLAGRLSERSGVEMMTKIGGTIAAAAGLALIAFALADVRHPLALFAPVAVSFIGSGLSQPSAMMSAIDAVPRSIGAGAGLLGALQLIAGAITSFAVGATLVYGVIGFSAICGGFLLLALAILRGVRS